MKGWAVALAVWTCAVGLGASYLWRYKLTPGVQRPAPPSWPMGSALSRAADRPTLVMAIHPHCPCTSASLRELEVVLARVTPPIKAYLLFVRPLGAEANFEKGALWERAQQLPGISVLLDEEGREAERFGALTSGQVLAYGRSGQLLFSGGITSYRGHQGNSAGAGALTAVLNGKVTDPQTAQVFGCALSSAHPGGTP